MHLSVTQFCCNRQCDCPQLMDGSGSHQVCPNVAVKPQSCFVLDARKKVIVTIKRENKGVRLTVQRVSPRSSGAVRLSGQVDEVVMMTMVMMKMRWPFLLHHHHHHTGTPGGGAAAAAALAASTPKLAANTREEFNQPIRDGRENSIISNMNSTGCRPSLAISSFFQESLLMDGSG